MDIAKLGWDGILSYSHPPTQPAEKVLGKQGWQSVWDKFKTFVSPNKNIIKAYTL